MFVGYKFQYLTSYILYPSFCQEYLMGNPENLLKGKTAIEKLGLTLQFIPMFSLTAFFRVGTGVPKVGSYKCFVWVRIVRYA